MATANADEDRTNSIKSKLVLGIGSDSNVAVDEVDTDSGQSDSRWTFAADLDLKQRVSKDTELRAAVSHSRDRYEKFSEFDLGTTLASVEVAHKFDDVSASASLRRIEADLARESFLTMDQASLNISSFVAKNLYLRTDYTYSETTFDTDEIRDQTQHAAGADVFLFLKGSDRFLTAGYRVQNEDAVGDQFDRRAQTIKLQYKHSFTAFDKKWTGRFKTDFRVRDYDAVTPSIGVVRDDERFRIGADLSVFLTKSLFLVLEYQFADYTSNFPAADYEQSTVELKLGYQAQK